MKAAFLSTVAIAGVVLTGFVVHDRSQLAGREQQSKDIYLVCRFYAEDHGGKYPNSVDELSPWHRTQRHEGVSTVVERYFAKFDLVATGLTVNSDATMILIREHAVDSRGRRVVCYSNGSSSVLHEIH